MVITRTITSNAASSSRHLASRACATGAESPPSTAHTKQAKCAQLAQQLAFGTTGRLGNLLRMFRFSLLRAGLGVYFCVRFHVCPVTGDGHRSKCFAGLRE